ncbi:hypothetical protein [Streptomyces scabiei]|uniref:hypothetical protein n=1 Tax=Streptomyces scabiei TaxID=1930 RepID=UPI0029ACC7ED|nr:hypothetical protein [Streptomyces scabiei]MDX3520702.1 hypothetical protein [Streptomyces scabiei]
MARLQILELPEGSGDERPPFVLVVDQMPKDEAAFEALRCDLGFATAQQIGARAVLVFEDTIDIARDMDRLAKRRDELADALGIDRLRDWDDIRNAAARLRKDRDSRAANTEKIRQIHTKTLQDDRYEDSGVCTADAEDWPCRTIQALNTKPGTNA